MVQVVCKGSESRLLDCFFPEQFGGDNDRGIHIAELRRGSCSSLSVMCRQFEIIGTHSRVAHLIVMPVKCICSQAAVQQQKYVCVSWVESAGPRVREYCALRVYLRMFVSACVHAIDSFC